MTYRERAYDRFGLVWQPIALVLLFCMMLGARAQADEVPAANSHRVIILTITDRPTGALIAQHALQADLKFDDLGHRRSA